VVAAVPAGDAAGLLGAVEHVGAVDDAVAVAVRDGQLASGDAGRLGRLLLVDGVDEPEGFVLDDEGAGDDEAGRAGAQGDVDLVVGRLGGRGGGGDRGHRGQQRGEGEGDAASTHGQASLSSRKGV